MEVKKIHSTSKDAFGKEKLNWRDNKLDYRSIVKQYEEVNRTVVTQCEEIKRNNKELTRKLTTIIEILQRLEKKQEERNSRKDAYVNKRYIPESQPMTLMIYNQLIDNRRTTTFCKYKDIRLRVIFCILFLTGIKLSQLLTLKVYQLQTLVENHCISINSLKPDSNNSKAFLTEEGKKVIQAREKDFEIIVSGKTPDSYVFTSEFRPDKMLRRETISRDNCTIKSKEKFSAFIL